MLKDQVHNNPSFHRELNRYFPQFTKQANIFKGKTPVGTYLSKHIAFEREIIFIKIIEESIYP
jgi:hypothetical protein